MSISESSSKRKKIFELEFTENVEDFVEMFLEDEESGADNRHLFDAAAFTQNPDDVQCSQKVNNNTGTIWIPDSMVVRYSNG